MVLVPCVILSGGTHGEDRARQFQSGSPVSLPHRTCRRSPTYRGSSSGGSLDGPTGVVATFAWVTRPGLARKPPKCSAAPGLPAERGSTRTARNRSHESDSAGLLAELSRSTSAMGQSRCPIEMAASVLSLRGQLGTINLVPTCRAGDAGRSAQPSTPKPDEAGNDKTNCG